jgi:membrane protein implicated in regulation of membrane protease activity
MGRVGGGITLIVVGAILTFALRVDVPGLGEYALGLILMLAGVALLVMHFMLENQRRHSHTVVEERGPVVEGRDEVVEEEPVVERRRRRRRVL